VKPAVDQSFEPLNLEVIYFLISAVFFKYFCHTVEYSNLHLVYSKAK